MKTNDALWWQNVAEQAVRAAVREAARQQSSNRERVEALERGGASGYINPNRPTERRVWRAISEGLARSIWGSDAAALRPPAGRARGR